MRLRKKHWALPIIEEHPEIVLQYELDQMIPIEEIFINAQPLCIEIGMGKGDFIIGLALKNPQLNFIGIEYEPNVLAYGVKKYLGSNSLPNLRFMVLDANHLTRLFVPHSIQTIYLNFSDPWPKKRHTKRRLTSKVFLDQYQNLLTKDGQIIQKTDNVNLYSYSKESFLENHYSIVCDDDYSLLHDDVMTEYEKRFRGLGNKIFRIVAKCKEESI